MGHGWPLIALAVDQPALADDAAVTYAVSMLGVLGRVIMTMLGSNGAANLAGSLQKAGAFVVTGAPGVLLDHLHHFPLRMAITPLHGQLVGTDLADTLEVRRPGEAATVLCCPNLTEADRVYPRLLGLDLAVPDHSKLSRKAETLQVALPCRGAAPCTRRFWRKLHVGVDADTRRIAAATLSTSGIDDASQVGALLDQGGPLASFTADAAHDERAAAP